MSQPLSLPEIRDYGDLDALLDAEEREKVEAARLDPITFMEYCFGWHCWPFHEEWQEMLFDHARVAIFAPNEHGKTNQITFARVLWELGRNPNLRIVLVSSTSGLATKTLGLIKQAIAINENLRRVFPDLRRESRPGWTVAWGTTRIIVERDDSANKDYSVQAVGMHGVIEGARVDLLVLDDILNFDNTRTPEQRELTISWLKSSAIPRTTVRSRVWAVGTPWHVDDAMHWLEKNREYHSKRYDAEDMLWPTLTTTEGQEYGWPRWRLEQREREYGTLEYNRSMRCQALTDTTRIFQPEWFERCMDLSGKAEFARSYHDSDLYVVTGVDLGHRKSSTSNETVLFTAGLNLATGYYETVHVEAGRGEIGWILARIIDVQARYAPLEFVVENVAAQDYLRQFIQNRDQILEIIGARVDPLAIQGLAMVRVVPFTTGANKAHPEYGVRGMTADLEHGRWRIHRNGETARWREEAVRYTETSHAGDRLMASWFAWHRLRARAMRSTIRAVTIGGGRDGQQAQRGNGRGFRLVTR